MSPTKVQLSLPRVTHLRVILLPIKRYTTTDRKPLISTLPIPTSKTEILSFLGLAGYLSLWIPNFTLLAQPLYQATQGDLSESLELKSNIHSAFKTLKQTILSAPALTLPDLSCPFILYTTERNKIALGVLGQNQGPSFTPVAYLSKQLDTTIQGWPAFLRGKKLTFGARTIIHSPHLRFTTLRTYFLTNP